MQKLFAAIDLGASSGRLIAARIGDGTVNLAEIHRFANVPIQRDSNIYWDIEALKNEIRSGLRKLGLYAEHVGMDVASIGVDSWAVDYGLVDGHGKLLGGVRHYRDERNALGVAAVEQLISDEELYKENGLQFLPFNTLYQLSAQQLQDAEAIANAKSMLLVPDLINFWLTGVALTEITNASTTGLLSLKTREWNWPLIETLGLKKSLFTELAEPGQVIGEFLTEFKTHNAFMKTVVMTVPSHDTAAAVAGAPLQSKDSAYLSSGTWSLLGIELQTPNTSALARMQNFTNEQGAAGRIRFLKNLSGMWLIQQSLAEFSKFDTELGLSALLRDAKDINSAARINVTDEGFAIPGDMPAKIQASCARSGHPVPQTPAAIIRCILDSLADAYADATKSLEEVSGVCISSIQIVGGGSQNDLLSQLTANATGKKVFSGPVEATTLGNLLTQAGAAGVVAADLDSHRDLIRSNFSQKEFVPAR